MSFSVDLWNGFDIIKQKINTTHKQIKNFNKLLSNYVYYEKEYCKNLDQLYKECKDTGNLDYPLEQSRISIINMIDFESKRRKELITYISKNIIEKISKFLSEPKISVDKIYYDNVELTQNFNKSINKLAVRQELFHSQCKELCSYLSQYELEKKMNSKADNTKVQKSYNKLLKSREEYLTYINETNIERDKYIFKKEELLNELEKTYRKAIENFKEYIYNFTTEKYKLIQKLYEKEKEDYEKYYSNIDIEQEALLFIMKNVTKEFPMIKIEFCSLKSNIIKSFLKSKYGDKLKEKDYNEILQSILSYFQKNNIFPNNLIQTGVSKIIEKNQFDFFSSRRFTKKDKNNTKNVILKKLNSVQEITREKKPEEKEAEILSNIKFVKNFLNELITNGKEKIFEDNYTNNESENIFKIDENKDKKELINKDDKVKELFNLINKSNESSSVYIETLIKTLSFLRSKGYFELSEYNIVLLHAFFTKILEGNPNNDYMIKNLLILSQTFYYIENGEKVYLQKFLKGNNILNCPQTWHRCINYSINLANTDKDLTIPIKKNELINKINREAFVTVVAYLCDIKTFTDNDIVYDKVKYFYSQIYNLDENQIKENVEDYLNSLKKKLQKNKEKEKNQINEKKNTETKTGNTEIKTNNTQEEKKDKKELTNPVKKENKLESENKEKQEDKKETNKSEIKDNDNDKKEEIINKSEDKQNVEDKKEIMKSEIIDNNDSKKEKNIINTKDIGKEKKEEKIKNIVRKENEINEEKKEETNKPIKDIELNNKKEDTKTGDKSSLINDFEIIKNNNENSINEINSDTKNIINENKTKNEDNRINDLKTLKKME